MAEGGGGDRPLVKPRPAGLKVNEEIYRGRFGTIYTGDLDGSPATVGRFSLPDKKVVSEDWKALQDLDHPHLVKFLGAFTGKKGISELFIVEGKVGINLRQFLDRNGAILSRQRRIEICVNIVRGVHWLHNSTQKPAIVHGNLNDKTIFVAPDGIVKVGGLAQGKLRFEHSDYTADDPFVPPEIFNNEMEQEEEFDVFSDTLDVYALGILQWEVLGNKRPNPIKHDQGRVEELLKRDPILFQDPHKDIIVATLGYCLEKNPLDRTTAECLHYEMLCLVEGDIGLKDGGAPNVNRKKAWRALMLGLDNAGKTALLYRLKLNEKIVTIPTIGFNVENVTIGKRSLDIWDVGGGDKLRPLWRHYYQATDGLIFVVDSTDKDRFPEAKQVIHALLKEADLKGVPIIILLNKQDIPDAVCPNDFEEIFQLGLLEDHPWALFGTDCEGVGLQEAFQKFCQLIACSKKNMKK